MNPHETRNPNFQISPEEVMAAFHKTSGSNYRHQVSIQKEHLRTARRTDSINEHCSELTEQQRQKFIEFCTKWGGANSYTLIPHAWQRQV